MSADTHTSGPRPATGIPGERRGRLATVDEDAFGRASGERRTPPREPMLTWAADSSLMPAVGSQPRLRQMFGVCGWAAVLGVVGLAVGLRGFVAALMHETPSWYEPMMIGIGLLGIALTVGAFISVQRRRTPFLLLGAATVVLAYAIFLTFQALS